MRWQLFLDPIEHLRAGQQIEKGVGVSLLCTALNTFLLLQGRAMASMHDGWLSGWLVGFGDSTVSPMPAFPKRFQWLGLILVPFVRHEVARVFIRETKDPVFCHRYPTGPCVGGNPGVRSVRDTVASA